VDAVYIATPPDSHLEYSLMVAAAGKHCCVEKPMALNAEQGALMQRTFERAGLHLFVSYYRRSLPRFQQVRDWLRDGRIGQLRHLTWSLCKPPAVEDTSAANWRTDPAIAGGGYFADLASHGFDLFQYLAGDIVEVAGFTARQAGQYVAEDAVTACWTFSSGALGMGCWNFVADRREDRVELIGTQGRITFAVFDDQPLRLEGEVDEVLEVPCHTHIQWHHVLGMNAHIRGDAEHPALAIEALKTDRILDKVLQRNPYHPE
jgi:1,5-anhydro-D-fructose reductase (1,5-anhydro-D-mannitol-forming)